MSFKYNVHLGKLVDKDVKLETVEDLNREINNVEEELELMENDRMRLELAEEIFAVSTMDAILRRMRKFKKILKSLTDLRKSRFGV